MTLSQQQGIASTLACVRAEKAHNLQQGNSGAVHLDF